MKTIYQYITEHMFSGKKVTIKSQNKYENTVNLGLPSGTLWCTCNIGAKEPEEYGEYFAWGEIETKKKYSAETYTNNDVVLNSSNDIVIKTYGDKYKMPSVDDFQELCDNTKIVNSVVNGIKVKKFISKNNESNFIIIPFGGMMYKDSNNDINQVGCIWLSTIEPSIISGKKWPKYGYMDSYDVTIYGGKPWVGFNVRGIVKNEV